MPLPEIYKLPDILQTQEEMQMWYKTIQALSKYLNGIKSASKLCLDLLFLLSVQFPNAMDVEEHLSTW